MWIYHIQMQTTKIKIVPTLKLTRYEELYELHGTKVMVKYSIQDYNVRMLQLSHVVGTDPVTASAQTWL